VNKSRFEQKIFGLDGLGNDVFDGWSDGTLWNGWGTPLFELDEAQRLLAVLVRTYDQMGESIQAWYDDKKDSFCFLFQGLSKPRCYPVTIIGVYGREVRVLHVCLLALV